LNQKLEIFFRELKDWSPSVARKKAKISEKLANWLILTHKEYSLSIDFYYIEKKKHSNNNHRYGSHIKSKFSKEDIKEVKVIEKPVRYIAKKREILVVEEIKKVKKEIPLEPIVDLPRGSKTIDS